MQEIWSRFEQWLSQHWPESLAYLNPPASDQQIARLEQKLHVNLPADFVACLKIHNGQNRYSSLFGGMDLLSCEEIHGHWVVWKELLDGGEFKDIHSAPDEGVRNDWWNPRWIPFTYNGFGDHFCLDLDPAPSGSPGQVIAMWHDRDERERKAISFAEYFDAYVNAVLEGKYVYAEEHGGLVNAADV